ncbi:MAG TPA: EVE domain-containing protein, partial [Dehalococcoidia bacterium]|nr:EVE domain-containing protein [Dehalococcoidia bacterium]
LDNFRASRDRDFTLQGIKSRHRKKAEKMRPGDRILYYITGLQVFGGTATIVGTYFEDHEPIWRSKKDHEDYPFRVPIRPDVILDEASFVPSESFVGRLEYLKKWPVEHWRLAFQGNVHVLPPADFEIVELDLRALAAPLAAR